jgi:hypothetical protein
MKTTATTGQLELALRMTNEEFGYQLSFETLKQISSKRVSFTLKTPSKVKGARMAASGRNLPKASWHAHGNFFDMLFEIAPNAIVVSQSFKITRTEGNWQDIKIGGEFQEFQYMSQTSIGE